MPETVVLLHGGYSNCPPSKERRQAIEIALRAVLDHATTMLSNRAAATDIAVEVVSMLEDCKLFNAGKGSVLTMAGDHEVSHTCGLDSKIP